MRSGLWAIMHTAFVSVFAVAIAVFSVEAFRMGVFWLPCAALPVLCVLLFFIGRVHYKYSIGERALTVGNFFFTKEIPAGAMQHYSISHYYYPWGRTQKIRLRTRGVTGRYWLLSDEACPLPTWLDAHGVPKRPFGWFGIPLE